MAYKVGFRGLEISCDNPEELRIAIATILGIAGDSTADLPVWKDRQASEQPTNGASRWTVDRFSRFLMLTRKNRSKKLLKMLIENPDGLFDEVLRRNLGVKTNMALAGVITGIVKSAQKVGVVGSEVFVRNRVAENVYEYRLAPALLEVARQYGWPKKSSTSEATQPQVSAKDLFAKLE